MVLFIGHFCTKDGFDLVHQHPVDSIDTGSGVQVFLAPLPLECVGRDFGEQH